jgi:hypothetical protein
MPSSYFEFVAPEFFQEPRTPQCHTLLLLSLVLLLGFSPFGKSCGVKVWGRESQLQAICLRKWADDLKAKCSQTFNIGF